MTTTVTLGARTIGPGQPCFLAAEVGTTSLGDLEKALRLVEAGAAAGVDAVKFQLIDPDQLSDPSVSYTFRSGGQAYEANMQEMFRRLSFTGEQWARIAEACRAAGVAFYATVDFLAGVDLLDGLGVPAHKLGAWDGTYRPLIEKIGATGKPMFVDLGPTTDEEIAQIVEWYRGAGGSAVLFLHDFHTGEDREMNLRAIADLHSRYPWPAGFSAPGRDDDLDMAALGLGAHHIEKRLVLDRGERAFHADESLEPAELKAWVARVRHVERALGEGGIRPSRSDREQSQRYYRSICTLRAVRAGESFTRENLGGKRPGTGLPTRRLPELWGTRARRDLPENTLLEPGDLE
jgi:sialic acid synthase SpsE